MQDGANGNDLEPNLNWLPAVQAPATGVRDTRSCEKGHRGWMSSLLRCSQSCLQSQADRMLDERSRGKAQVFVRVIPSMCHALELFFILHSSFVSHIFFFILLNFDFYLSFLPCGCLWSKIPCAFPPNEASGLLGNNALSKVMSPTSSTISITQRPLNFSSSNSPTTRGPRFCMTRRSVTKPSAERSLHHCSHRSEKNQRAVEKRITLLKNVCCQVIRCLSVM